MNKGMTDNKFLSIIRKASAGDRYYFTFSQLYSAWCRAKDTTDLCSVIFIGYMFSVPLFLWLLPDKVFLLSFIPFLVIALIHGICNRRPPNQEKFRTLVEKWSNAKGFPDKMLMSPSLHEPPPEFQEGDLYDYGVERIIIVERPILVDLLVRNDFHADQKALVFSMDGYPSYIAEKAKTLLKESPDLPVYLLHDATEKGMRMHKKIKLPGHHPVIDLGVFPKHMENLSVLKPLRLKHKEFRSPIDVLPYAALSAIGGAAIAAGIPFDEVLASWKQEGSSMGDSSASNYG